MFLAIYLDNSSKVIKKLVKNSVDILRRVGKKVEYCIEIQIYEYESEKEIESLPLFTTYTLDSTTGKFKQIKDF
jgi:hypothetical protein